MKKKDIYAAVLAGGKGERLWPKSRISFPKQNLRLSGAKTCIQEAVGRAGRIAGRNIFIVTSKLTAPHTIRQVKRSRVKNIIIEPLGRNTAPAVGLAALLAHRENKDSILVAMPSDAIIKDEKKFSKAVTAAIKAAAGGKHIVTLGIKPGSAETAYGYIGIKLRSSRISMNNAYEAADFVEKPDIKTAKRLVRSNKFFWNSGIFIFKTSMMLSMLKKYTPALHRGLMSLPGTGNRHMFDAKLKALYGKIKSESLDYAVLEKTDNIKVIPSGFRWSDLGSFESVARLMEKDRSGNVISGEHVGLDTKNSLVLSDPDRLVATIGISGLVVAVTADAILICDRKKIGNIKKLVKKIRERKELVRFL